MTAAIVGIVAVCMVGLNAIAAAGIVIRAYRAARTA